jgi:hypothetical protein
MAARKRPTKDEADAAELDRRNTALAAALGPNETTSLTPDREAQFQQWAKQNQIHDVDHPDSHYDYRGYWNQYSDQPHQQGTHFTDEFKQHGHPTFSGESNYSKSFADGGHWEYGPGNAERVVPTAPEAKPPDLTALDEAYRRMRMEQQ